MRLLDIEVGGDGLYKKRAAKAALLERNIEI